MILKDFELMRKNGLKPYLVTKLVPLKTRFWAARVLHWRDQRVFPDREARVTRWTPKVFQGVFIFGGIETVIFIYFYNLAILMIMDDM